MTSSASTTSNPGDNVVVSRAGGPLDAKASGWQGGKEGICLFNHGSFDMLARLPLPGLVILVHGVNSDGEWYRQTEQGLCKGLNDRLARNDDQLVHKGVDAGQLTPSTYMPELTPDGFINPDLTSKSFIQPDPSFSNVIRFRWGFKASDSLLRKFGHDIALNEQNYWGGGPFANGCSSLPDLWGDGIVDQLFGWIHLQHINPTNDRIVLSTPPRAYGVLAALRLARLVQSIRQKQHDCPITIVCHSQGNMVGMTAAFLGKRLPAVDGRPCVADSYVLCNPPYSLVADNVADNLGQLNSRDALGHVGRQTGEARRKTLSAFFEIIRGNQGMEQLPDVVNQQMGNRCIRRPYTAEFDRAHHGLNGCTYGRVTLYCNPHDQVISSSTIQGIGWRGMSADEIKATGGQGVFSQRVFSQGFTVGERGSYDYWHDQHNRPTPDRIDFWCPPSPGIGYFPEKGLEANESGIGRFGTVALGKTIVLFKSLTTSVVYAGNPALAALPPPPGKVSTSSGPGAINASPPVGWTIPLDAPNLPEPFKPVAISFGKPGEEFDQGFDPPSAQLNKTGRLSNDPSDPYNQQAARAVNRPQGDAQSESELRYAQHADNRMFARRDGLIDKNAEHIEMEDHPETASATYTAWRSRRITQSFDNNLTQHATDHSTIVTNPDHAQKALAYDVAIGICEIAQADIDQLRIVADWRMLNGLDKNDPNKAFFEYFDKGLLKKLELHDWLKKEPQVQLSALDITDKRGGLL